MTDQVLLREIRLCRRDIRRLKNLIAPVPGRAVARSPLARHVQKLIKFLRSHGPATRGEIVAATGIPNSSLSVILKGKEFKQVQRGIWSARHAAP